MSEPASEREDDARLDALMDAAAERIEAKQAPDAQDREELRTLDREQRRLAVAVQKEELKSRRKERRLRTSYANKVFNFLCAYSGFCGGILVLEGFHIYGFSIDRYVVVALVGSTAIAAIGVVSSVVKGLFPPTK